jgi:peptide/nickel transport system substrate-binding protein
LPDREFTARDVKFTFDCVLNPHIDAAHIRSYFENPEAKDESERFKISVSIVDDYTVQIRWTEPYFLAELFTLAGVPMIPRHVYSVDEHGEPISFDFTSKEFAEGFNHHWASSMMCGTGPMMFREWVRDERLVLDRFNDYWGEPFYFSQIRMRCIPNTNTMVQMTLQNELDWTGFPDKDQWLQSAGSVNVKDGRVKLVEFDFPGYRYIGYNLNRPVFRDREFRLALAHATPLQQIIDEVFHGLAIPVSGPFLPGSSAADDSIQPIPFDLDKARQLLDQAGWRDTDGDGVRDKVIDGVRVPAAFDLMIFSDSRSFRAIAEMIQEEFRKIGVRMQITPAEWALMLDRLEFEGVRCGHARLGDRLVQDRSFPTLARQSGRRAVQFESRGIPQSGSGPADRAVARHDGRRPAAEAVPPDPSADSRGSTVHLPVFGESDRGPRHAAAEHRVLPPAPVY